MDKSSKKGNGSKIDCSTHVCNKRTLCFLIFKLMAILFCQKSKIRNIFLIVFQKKLPGSYIFFHPKRKTQNYQLLRPLQKNIHALK